MTLEEMRGRLARLDDARKEFIANASHELRTPIFSLGGFVELIDEDDPDPAVRAEFVATMREQIERLTKLTTDLLDLSKLDADALHGPGRPDRPHSACERRSPRSSDPRRKATHRRIQVCRIPAL